MMLRIIIVTYLRYLWEYIFLFSLSFLQKEIMLTRLPYCVYVCLDVFLLQLFNQLTHFHNISYNHYATEGHSNIILFNFLLQ
jgi:hypothetical protein